MLAYASTSYAPACPPFHHSRDVLAVVRQANARYRQVAAEHRAMLAARTASSRARTRATAQRLSISVQKARDCAQKYVSTQPLPVLSAHTPPAIVVVPATGAAPSPLEAALPYVRALPEAGVPVSACSDDLEMPAAPELRPIELPETASFIDALEDVPMDISSSISRWSPFSTPCSSPTSSTGPVTPPQQAEERIVLRIKIPKRKYSDYESDSDEYACPSVQVKGRYRSRSPAQRSTQQRNKRLSRH